MTPMTEGFLVGVIFTTSLTASLFFLKFWKRTRDLLFLAFALAFFVEASARVSLLFTDKPNESGPWYYIVRMLAFLLIVVAIIKNNYRKSS